jgi:membrane protein
MLAEAGAQFLSSTGAFTMSAPSHFGHSQRPSPPHKAWPKSKRPMSGNLMLMATLIGISRAILGRQKQGPIKRALTGVSEAVSTHERGRGRDAEKPTDIPAKGWKDIAWRVYESIQNDRVLLVSAGVTYYGLLALFPATAAIVSLYGLFADASSINEHLRLVSGFLPEGALEVIGDQVKRIAAQGQATLGFTFLGTLALSLWGANAGTKAIFDALNITYKEREKRGFFKLTLYSLAFTIGAMALALVSLAGIIAVPIVLKMLGIPEHSGAGLLTLLRWPLLYLILLFGLACLYRYGPSRSHPRWRWVTWGSAIAGVLWIIGSLLLSWYVSKFGTYNATYGTLGAVIGFMVWLWLSTIIVLIGGEVNAELEHQTVRDTTEGRKKPMGTRGAKMADEIGGARA